MRSTGKRTSSTHAGRHGWEREVTVVDKQGLEERGDSAVDSLDDAAVAVQVVMEANEPAATLRSAAGDLGHCAAVAVAVDRDDVVLGADQQQVGVLAEVRPGVGFGLVEGHGGGAAGVAAEGADDRGCVRALDDRYTPGEVEGGIAYLDERR
jgi:hypothetical protein